MAKKDRLEKIRKVRSLNDILEIIKEISKEVGEDAKTVNRLQTSLSAARDETIEINRGRAPKTTRINTKNKPQKHEFSGLLQDFKAPPAAQVEKHSLVVQRLYENAKELDAAEAMLKQAFSGVKNQRQALAGIKALRQEVDASISKALGALNGIATKHFPSDMEELRDQLTSYLLDSVPESNYSDLLFLEYVTLGDSGEIVFSVYIEIKQLRNDKGYVFDDYIIVLTGVVNAKGAIAYYINSHPEFRAPGKIPLGKQIANVAQMQHQASMLLAHNNISTDLDRRPMPLSHDDAKARGFDKLPGVDGVVIKDDALLLRLVKSDPATHTRIVKEVIPLLNQAIGRKKDTAISWKPVTVGSKKYLKFILFFKPDGSGKNEINRSKFKDIQDLLNLDERTSEQLRKGLRD